MGPMHPRPASRRLACAALSLALIGFAGAAWAQPREVVVEQRVTVRTARHLQPAGAFGGPFFRGRLGPGLEVGHRALGGWLGVMAGWESRAGLGFALTLGARYHAAPDYAVFDVALGTLFRVSALPASRFHPFGEIGPALHLTTEDVGGVTGSSVVFGGDAALGLEVDLTRHVSVDLAGRGEILVRANGPVQVVLTPMAGVVIRP